MMLYQSSTGIKRAIKSHSWVGLGFAIFLYVICFSGTVSVFLQEFERWQQPDVVPFTHIDGKAINTAYEQLLSRQKEPADTLWVILPDDKGFIRAHASDGEHEWFMDQQGNLGQSVKGAWVDMVRNLHYYLHLPETAGMIIVGIIGVFFMALIISGILAHTSIIKDAFKLRLGKSDQLQQTDIHNRIGVWGLPFVMMIAITGAFVGVANVFIFMVATLNFNGNTDDVVDMIYGKDPVLESPVTPFNATKAIASLKDHEPSATPIYLAFHKPGTSQQFLEIAATLPERLLYSEIYRFDAQGNFINSQHLSDGPAGRQISYSVYRLHFGQFDGLMIKVFYAIFGLAATVLVVTGVNIWLAKRRYQTWLNRYWHASVWGLPLAMTVSAGVALWQPHQVIALFWFLWLFITFALSQISLTKISAQQILGASLLVLVACYYLRFGSLITDNTAHAINLGLATLGVYFLSRTLASKKTKTVYENTEVRAD